MFKLLFLVYLTGLIGWVFYIFLQNPIDSIIDSISKWLKNTIRFQRKVERKIKKTEKRISAEIQKILRELDAEYNADDGIVDDTRSRSKHFTNLEINAIANRIVEQLKPFCENITLVGSIRRNSDVVNDIDVLIVLKKDADATLESRNMLISALEKIADDEEFIVNNETDVKGWSFTCGHIPVDVIKTTKDSWGMDSIVFTGSRAFNRIWKQKAIRRGYEVQHERTIVRNSGSYYYGSCVTAFEGQSEERILRQLGLEDYFDPKTRNI